MIQELFSIPCHLGWRLDLAEWFSFAVQRVSLLKFDNSFQRGSIQMFDRFDAYFPRTKFKPLSGV